MLCVWVCMLCERSVNVFIIPIEIIRAGGAGGWKLLPQGKCAPFVCAADLRPLTKSESMQIDRPTHSASTSTTSSGRNYTRDVVCASGART